jgi:hypothetical protein
MRYQKTYLAPFYVSRNSATFYNVLSKNVPGTFSPKHAAREREKPVGVQGIGVESPQDLHGQIRGLGADSPVFYGQGICGENS